MGWREPEAQDVGKVVFNRAFRRTEVNLIRARETLKQAFLSRHEGERASEGRLAEVDWGDSGASQPHGVDPYSNFDRDFS